MFKEYPGQTFLVVAPRTCRSARTTLGFLGPGRRGSTRLFMRLFSRLTEFDAPPFLLRNAESCRTSRPCPRSSPRYNRRPWRRRRPHSLFSRVRFQRVRFQEREADPAPVRRPPRPTRRPRFTERIVKPCKHQIPFFHPVARCAVPSPFPHPCPVSTSLYAHLGISGPSP